MGSTREEPASRPVRGAPEGAAFGDPAGDAGPGRTVPAEALVGDPAAAAPAAVRAALGALPLGHTESFRKTVGETDVYLFAGITGDFSPIHVDEEFAQTTRFGGRIAHGALLVGFVSTVMGQMTARLPAPGGVSYQYVVTFRGPVRLGDTVTTTLTLAEARPERRELVFRARATNQRGETVLDGQTTLKLV